MRSAASLALLVCLGAWAQQPEPSQPPPRSDGGISSSKETKVDLSAPPGEAPVSFESEPDADVVEMTPYDPHRAEKAIEVGEYYLKRKNLKAAESRFQEALEFKPHDPAATMLLGVVYERTQRPLEAYKLYVEYLAATPAGERAEQANQGVERLRAAVQDAGANPDRIRADALARVADRFYQARNWPLARERFAEALGADARHPLATLRMAQVLEQLGEFDAAVKAYDAYLALPDGGDNEAARAARERLVKVGAGRNR
jgi:tetratricopeptide (TPR) repeat protein